MSCLETARSLSDGSKATETAEKSNEAALASTGPPPLSSKVALLDASLDPKDSPYTQVTEGRTKIIRPIKPDSRAAFLSVILPEERSGVLCQRPIWPVDRRPRTDPPNATRRVPDMNVEWVGFDNLIVVDKESKTEL